MDHEQPPLLDGKQRDPEQGERAHLLDQPLRRAARAVRSSAERVTPVEGDVPRVNSVLTYGESPDMRLNDLTSLLFYGRTST